AVGRAWAADPGSGSEAEARAGSEEPWVVREAAAGSEAEQQATASSEAGRQDLAAAWEPRDHRTADVPRTRSWA
ncbi:MAG: hypothetical protein ABR540_08830, partial [Acidimicrobiales bacterium]